MIGYIRGTITASWEGGVMIENGGIGYRISVPSTSPAFQMEGTGRETVLYTAMSVREDGINLYGFSTEKELAMFRMLTAVSGVGAKAALSVLSALSAEEAARAVLFDDPATIARAQGIGKKIAQRIVLELKDKLGDFSGFSAGEPALEGRAPSGKEGDPKAEALEAMEALGFSRSEASEALSRVQEPYTDPQSYIKAALAGGSKKQKK